MLHKSPAGGARRSGAHGPAKTERGSGASTPALLPAVALGGVDRGNREGEGVSAACQNHQLGLQGRNGNQRGPECPDGGEDQRVCFTHPQWNLMQGGNSHPLHPTDTHTHTCNTYAQMFCFSFLMFISHYKSNEISLKTM